MGIPLLYPARIKCENLLKGMTRNWVVHMVGLEPTTSPALTGPEVLCQTELHVYHGVLGLKAPSLQPEITRRE